MSARIDRTYYWNYQPSIHAWKAEISLHPAGSSNDYTVLAKRWNLLVQMEFYILIYKLYDGYDCVQFPNVNSTNFCAIAFSFVCLGYSWLLSSLPREYRRNCQNILISHQFYSINLVHGVSILHSQSNFSMKLCSLCVVKSCMDFTCCSNLSTSPLSSLYHSLSSLFGFGK